MLYHCGGKVKGQLLPGRVVKPVVQAPALADPTIPRGVWIRHPPAQVPGIPGIGRAGDSRKGCAGGPAHLSPPSSPRSPPGPALLQGSLRLRTRKRWRAGLQGRRHHHPDQPDRRKLVRGHDQRPVGLLPPQLRGSAGSATSVKRHRSRPLSARAGPSLHSTSILTLALSGGGAVLSLRHLGVRLPPGNKPEGSNDPPTPP